MLLGLAKQDVLFGCWCLRRLRECKDCSCSLYFCCTQAVTNLNCAVQAQLNGHLERDQDVDARPLPAAANAIAAHQQSQPVANA